MTTAPVAAPKQTLSLTSMILGLASFLFAAVPFANFLSFVGGIVAVILGFRSRKSEPAAPSWMRLTGIIAGFVSLGLSLILGIVYLIAFVGPFLFLAACGNSVC